MIIGAEWTTEHVITGECDIPEGKVFLGDSITRDVRYESPADCDVRVLDCLKTIPYRGPAAFDAKSYLIAGNYVFAPFDQSWDAAAQGLSAQYRDDLPSATPVFFFPLGVARVWSSRLSEERDYQAGLLAMAGKGLAPNPSTYYWMVEGREDVLVPYSKVQNAMKLMYTANCGSSMVWFKEGLGVVKAQFIHGGSFWEEQTELIDFTAARTTK